MTDYTPPTAAEFRSMLLRFGLTGAKAAELVGTNGRMIRRYTGGDADVPYSVLFTIVAKQTGRMITPGGWKEEISDG